MPEPVSASALATVDTLISQHKELPGALMPLLHAVQDALGFVPDEVVPRIAAELNLSRAEVHGVITFYHHFRREPAGHTVVQVCRAEACQSCGSDALMAHAQERLGCAPHHTAADGSFTLEPVYCLGLCASSPAIRVGERLHARVTPEKFDRLVAAAFVESAGVVA
jgi:formate dehydrogenase subunit gamma